MDKKQWKEDQEKMDTVISTNQRICINCKFFNIDIEEKFKSEPCNRCMTTESGRRNRPRFKSK